MKFPGIGLLLIGAGAYAYSLRDNKASPKHDDINLPIQPKVDKPLEIKERKAGALPGKLFITVYLKASGAEKFAISMGAFGGEQGLRDSVMKTAQKLIPELNKGPIPKIISKGYPKSFKSVDNGYKIEIAYIAMFHEGAKAEPIRKNALSYITSVLKSDKEFGPRILKVSATKVN